MTDEPVLWQISNSEIQNWKNCHRRWYLDHYLQIQPKRDNVELGARALGTKVHIALQGLYDHHQDPVVIIRALYQEDIDKWPNAVDALRKELDLAVAMLEGYVMWLEETGADEGLDLVAAETVITVPFPPVPGVELRGKLDQRLHRQIDGARLFLDHKTVGAIVTGAELAINEQMKFYTLLEYLDARAKTGEAPAEPTDGGIYNMLRKVKRTAAAKPPFYERVEVRYNTEVLRSMWLRTLKVIEEIVAGRAALDAGCDHRYLMYPRPDPTCTWKCPHINLCPMMDDGSNWQGMVAEHYEHVDPHERYNQDERSLE